MQINYCELHQLYGKEFEFLKRDIGFTKREFEISQGNSLCISCNFEDSCALTENKETIDTCEEFQN